MSQLFFRAMWYLTKAHEPKCPILMMILYAMSNARKNYLTVILNIASYSINLFCSFSWPVIYMKSCQIVDQLMGHEYDTSLVCLFFKFWPCILPTSCLQIESPITIWLDPALYIFCAKYACVFLAQSKRNNFNLYLDTPLWSGIIPHNSQTIHTTVINKDYSETSEQRTLWGRAICPL